MTRIARMRRLSLAAAACTGVVAAACTGTDAGSGARSGVSVVDSAGVTVVGISDMTALSVPERDATLSAEVGSQAGTELFRVSAARLLESGTLVIGNSGTGEVLYVDGAGEVVRRAGGEGDGPGEFRAITSFPDVRGDTLTVYDVRLGRLTVLDPEGEVVEIRRLAPPSRVVDLLPLAIGDGGRVLAVHGDARIFARSGVRRDTAPLMVVHPSSSVDTLGWWPAKEWSFASTGQASFRTEVGFGRSLQTSGRNGRAVLGSTDRLLLVLVGPDGTETMRIEGAGPNRSVSQEQVERWRAGRLGDLPDDVPATLRSAIEAAPHHETFPAFFGVLLDADARIWIGETQEPGTADRRWTVFAPDGPPSFRVVLPASATPLDAAGDRLVVLDRTEMAEEIVRVLSLGEPVRPPP